MFEVDLVGILESTQPLVWASMLASFLVEHGVFPLVEVMDCIGSLSSPVFEILNERFSDFTGLGMQNNITISENTVLGLILIASLYLYYRSKTLGISPAEYVIYLIVFYLIATPLVLTSALSSTSLGVLFTLLILVTSHIVVGFNLTTRRPVVFRIFPLGIPETDAVGKKDRIAGASVGAFIIPALIMPYTIHILHPFEPLDVWALIGLIVLYTIATTVWEAGKGAYVSISTVLAYTAIFMLSSTQSAGITPDEAMRYAFTGVLMGVILADIIHGLLIPLIRGIPESTAIILGGAALDDAVITMPVLGAISGFATAMLAARTSYIIVFFGLLLVIEAFVRVSMDNLKLLFRFLERAVNGYTIAALLICISLLIYLDDVAFRDFVALITGTSTPGVERARLILWLLARKLGEAFLGLILAGLLIRLIYDSARAALGEVLLRMHRIRARRGYGHALWLADGLSGSGLRDRLERRILNFVQGRRV